MKGKIPDFKDRDELTTFLLVLRNEFVELSHAIDDLKEIARKPYWDAHDREYICDHVRKHGKYPAEFQRLLGKLIE